MKKLILTKDTLANVTGGGVNGALPLTKKPVMYVVLVTTTEVDLGPWITHFPC